MDKELLPDSIPFIAYEAALARQERMNRRLFVALMMTFGALLVSCFKNHE